MTFLLNRAGSKQWSEIDRDELKHLIEPALGLPVDHQVIPWIDDAEHGQIVLLDGVRIVCIDLDEPEDDQDEGQSHDGAGKRMF